MDKTKQLEIILVEWIASLKSRDRSRKAVRPNFEDLFQKWKDADAMFDDLYEPPTGEVKGLPLLQRAIKAHMPISSIVRNTYKKLKQTIAGFDKTEKEFIEEWNSAIEATGQEVFFEFFPAMPIDYDPEPKVYGNMSAKEYKAQRKYVDAIPIIDTTELEKQWLADQGDLLSVEDILNNILGKKDETN